MRQVARFSSSERKEDRPSSVTRKTTEEKCQLLPSHVKAKSLQSNDIFSQPSQVGFIAKRIHYDTLINQLKGQEERNEEKAVETEPMKFKRIQIDSISGGLKEVLQIQSPKKPPNIFSEAKLIQSRMCASGEQQEGPRTSENGKIIGYTLAGKPEWYFNQQVKESALHRTTIDTVCSSDTQRRNLSILCVPEGKQQSEESEVACSKLEHTVLFPRPWFLQADKNFVSDVKYVRKKQKAELAMMKARGNKVFVERFLTTDQVKQRVADVEERLLCARENNEKKNKEIFQGMTISERLASTREGRIMEKVYCAQQQFDDTVTRQSSQMKRDPHHSILLSGQQYRHRIESITAQEAIKQERVVESTTVLNWAIGLRNSIITSNSINKPKWQPQTQKEQLNQPRELEVIRNRRSMSYQPEEKRARGRLYSSQNKAPEQIQEIFPGKNEHQSEKVRFALITKSIDQGLCDLRLIGENKFKKEKASIIGNSSFSSANKGPENDDTISQCSRDEVLHLKKPKQKHSSNFANPTSGITFKETVLKKQSMNEVFDESYGMAVGQAANEQESSIVDLNQTVCEALREQASDLNCLEEKGIHKEEVIFSDWRDRKILANSSRLVQRKAQLFV